MRTSVTQLQLALADLAGLLEHLVDRIPGAETALLLTADGRAMATWGGAFPRSAAEISSLASTLRGMVGQWHFGPVWRTLVALDHQLFALAPAGPDAIFGVTLNGLAALDSVLDDTADAAEQAGRVLAAHDVHSDIHIDTAAWTFPTETLPARSATRYAPLHSANGTATLSPAGSSPLNFCDTEPPSDDELERMLLRLRSL
jgi:hypothetical protein